MRERRWGGDQDEVVSTTDHLPLPGWWRQRLWCRLFWPFQPIIQLTTWGQSQGLARGRREWGEEISSWRRPTPNLTLTSTGLPSLGLTTKIRLYLVWAVSATRCPWRRGQTSQRVVFSHRPKWSRLGCSKYQLVLLLANPDNFSHSTCLEGRFGTWVWSLSSSDPEWLRAENWKHCVQ